MAPVLNIMLLLTSLALIVYGSFNRHVLKQSDESRGRNTRLFWFTVIIGTFQVILNIFMFLQLSVMSAL